MAINYTYTHGSTTDRTRLRLLIGDHRGVDGTYATNALFVANSSAMFCDEELDDILLAAISNGDVMHAARIAMQIRMNREAMLAGVSGTTDTSDRSKAIAGALELLANLDYTPDLHLPKVRRSTNDDLEDLDHDLDAPA